MGSHMSLHIARHTKPLSTAWVNALKRCQMVVSGSVIRAKKKRVTDASLPCGLSYDSVCFMVSSRAWMKRIDTAERTFRVLGFAKRFPHSEHTYLRSASAEPDVRGRDLESSRSSCSEERLWTSPSSGVTLKRS